jgi:small conductance mechanosensitive channel
MPAAFMDQLTPLALDAALWAAKAALRVGLIVLAGVLGLRLLALALRRLQEVLARAAEPAETVPGATRKRVATVLGLAETLARVLVWAVVGVTSLAQLGFDVTPLLAGAGIAGLAVSFGAQNLVRDLISGFFLVLENHVRVGDVAVVNGTGGLVEAITFRTIVLRDLAGVVHVFPHGAVTTLANMTKNWSAYVIDVGVAYKEDTDRVVEIMRRVAEEIQQDPQLAPHVLEPLEIFGVDKFGESEVTIKARWKTLPLQQWKIGREYRRRLKKAFDTDGVEIPFPHRSLYVGEASKPLPVLLTGESLRAS